MKVYYSVKSQHDEKSIVALAHMQYDLFCQNNLLIRTGIAAACIIIAMKFLDSWWAYLLIAYAGFLLTGKYNSANHTANKLIANIKSSGMSFPCSCFDFKDKAVTVSPVPISSDDDIVTLPYSNVVRLGEDGDRFYIFRDEYGGYVIPKEAFGDKMNEFKLFIESRTGLRFIRRATAFNRVSEYLRKKNSEPYHL